MGLDMYLSAEKYVSGWPHNGSPDPGYQVLIDTFGVTPTPDSPSFHVDVTIGYWRKANAIHAWFVRETQDGRDECQRSYVGPDQLRGLRDLVVKVLDEPGTAKALLPTESGFFFGSTEYDKWYVSDLRHTLEVIDRALTLVDEGWSIYYRASW